MPDRNEHPPEEVARLAQVLSGGFAAPRSLRGDKLRLQKWLAAHPSCEYPIAFSIAVFHAAGVATDNLPPGTSIEKYAGLLFRGLWRNGSLPNCKPDRVMSTNSGKAWSFVQFAGTTVGTHAMATLLSCIDHMTAVHRRLIDGCIAGAIISTAEELAAMNTLVKSITLFPLAYDALRTTTPWATVAAEEGLKTLLASLLHAARAGALIVSDMEFDLDYGGLREEADDDEAEEKDAAAAAAPLVVEQREEDCDHSSDPFGGLRAASGRFATAEAVAAQVAEYFARHRELAQVQAAEVHAAAYDRTTTTLTTTTMTTTTTTTTARAAASAKPSRPPGLPARPRLHLLPAMRRRHGRGVPRDDCCAEHPCRQAARPRRLSLHCFGGAMVTHHSGETPHKQLQ
jgi:hypothetical protein